MLVNVTDGMLKKALLSNFVMNIIVGSNIISHLHYLLGLHSLFLRHTVHLQLQGVINSQIYTI